LDSHLLFASGSDKLSDNAKKTLLDLAQALQMVAETHDLQVEGHTDNQAIHTSQFPSNWQLAGDRAAAVVTFWLEQHQFLPQKLAAVGYADSRPLADNATETGRSKNRRIDIVVIGQDLTLPEVSLPDVAEQSSALLKPLSDKLLKQNAATNVLAEHHSLPDGIDHKQPSKPTKTIEVLSPADAPPGYIAPTFGKVDLGIMLPEGQPHKTK
jgi:hypothetical protein